MKVQINAKFMNELHMAVFKATQESYVDRIVENTPWDTGITAGDWFFYPVSPFKYKLTNDNGEVVLFLEKGTGIYGPLKKRIYPKEKKALRWYDRKKGKWAFAKSVKGIKPRHFVAAVVYDPSVKQVYYKRLTHHMKSMNGGK